MIAPAVAPVPSRRKNPRRPTLVLSCAFIAAPSDGAGLSRQRECLRFNFDEAASDRTNRAIETRRLRGHEVGKEPADPRCEMFIKELPLLFGRSRKFAPSQASHDLAQDRGMVFGLALCFAELDAQPMKIGAQARQRTLVQEAG